VSSFFTSGFVALRLVSPLLFPDSRNLSPTSYKAFHSSPHRRPPPHLSFLPAPPTTSFSRPLGIGHALRTPPSFPIHYSQGIPPPKKVLVTSTFFSSTYGIQVFSPLFVFLPSPSRPHFGRLVKTFPQSYHETRVRYLKIKSRGLPPLGRAMTKHSPHAPPPCENASK